MGGLYGLLADGLVYIDPEQQAPDNWRWKLSERGLKVVSGGPWELVSRDQPRGTMRVLADPGWVKGRSRRIRSFRSLLGRLERCAGARSGSNDQQSSR
ncbi:hypothetical protein GCM10010176_102940 [Nonomuraea spiralis]|nr:hypothetical protein GCM10010176_102940 [Nonomuraea spiralis]